MNRILIFISLFLFFACNPSKRLAKDMSIPVKPFPYQIYNYSTVNLPDELIEISALTTIENDNLLACVEDEHGILYFINKRTGEIVERKNFHKDGDYEGLEYFNGHFYVLKSSGTIYKIDSLKPDESFSKMKNFLNKENDAEGIGYDVKTNSFLIACKNTSSEDLNARCVYRYDLKTNQFLKDPILTISRSILQEYLRKNFSEEFQEENFKKIFDVDRQGFHFGPSGIAIHPLNNEIYIISSRSKMLLVYNEESQKITFVQKLNKKIHPQPEGICFDKEGNLFIANEGKDGPGNLVMYPFAK